MELAQAQAIFSKFDRAWPKAMIGDVEVYAPSLLMYYGGHFRVDEVFKRFIGAMGMNYEEFIKQDVDEDIENMWFTMGPYFWYSGKRAYDTDVDPTDGLTRPTRADIADALNAQLSVGETIDVTISYGGSVKRYLNEHDLGWEATGLEIKTTPLNTAEIRTVLASNPWYFYANSRHIPYTKGSYPFQLYDGSGTGVTTQGRFTPQNTAICDVATTTGPLGIMALLDTNDSFEPVLNDDGSPYIVSENMTTRSDVPGTTSKYDIDVAEDNSLSYKETGKENRLEGSGEITRYDYVLRFTYNGVTENSSIVHDLYEWYDYYYQDTSKIPIKFYTTDRKREILVTSTIDTKIKKELIKLMTAEETNSLYYGGYLRVDAATKMKKREFRKMIGSCIGTDFSVKKASAWEKVVAYLLVLIAIIITVMSFGGGWPAIATALAYASAILTIGSMILSQAGGLSAQGLVKQLGNFATILGIAGIIAGLWTAIQNYAVSGVLAESAGQGVSISAEMAGATVQEMGIGEVISYAIDGVIKSIKSVLTGLVNTITGQGAGLGASAINDTLETIVKVYEYQMDKEKAKLDQEYENLQAADAVSEEDYQNRQYMHAPGVLMHVHEQSSTPDALQSLAADIQSRIGRDKIYSRWEADVNHGATGMS